MAKEIQDLIKQLPNSNIEGCAPDVSSVFTLQNRLWRSTESSIRSHHPPPGNRSWPTTAVNAAIEAIAKGRNSILLVMATDTGKTYTAFQIVWRMCKAGRKKRILFLASRIGYTAAIDTKRRIDTAYDVWLGLYQAITGPEEQQKLYREFSPDFFDLIVIDECHRGSAAEDSAWRETLEYLCSATQIGRLSTSLTSPISVTRFTPIP